MLCTLVRHTANMSPHTTFLITVVLSHLISRGSNTRGPRPAPLGNQTPIEGVKLMATVTAVELKALSTLHKLMVIQC